MVRNKSYSWKQVDQSKFQVKFQSVSTIDNDSTFEIDDNTGIMSAPIPLFSRILTIQVNSNVVMICDCYFFESAEFLCAPRMAVTGFRYGENDGNLPQKAVIPGITKVFRQ